MNLFLLFGGLALLFVSGELLVSGSVKVAYRFKVSKLVVGLTVVSLGTSAPELFVSLIAALKGHPDIAVGNVIGSNIANIGLVIAITVIFFPIIIDKKIIKVDYPVMLLATLIFYLIFAYGTIEWPGGIVLLLILSIYIIIIVRKSRREIKANDEVIPITTRKFFFAIISILVGGVGLYFGSGWFLEGATGMAKIFGLSDHIIGVTIVAFGTSVPELATSFMAAYRKHGDIAIGNILGSNVFNIFAVIGTTSLFKKITFIESLSTDIYWMIGFALFLAPAFYIHRKLNWPYGIILLSGYCTYIYLALAG
jgi:cation:H+ antiporter